MHGRSDAPIEDAAIAATAQAHDLVVVTRNAKGFRPLQVRILDPFQHGRA